MEDRGGLDEETRVLGDSFVSDRNESGVKEPVTTEPLSHAGTLLAQSIIAVREEIT